MIHIIFRQCLPRSCDIMHWYQPVQTESPGWWSTSMSIQHICGKYKTDNPSKLCGRPLNRSILDHFHCLPGSCDIMHWCQPVQTERRYKSTDIIDKFLFTHIIKNLKGNFFKKILFFSDRVFPKIHFCPRTWVITRAIFVKKSQISSKHSILLIVY